MYRPFTKQHSYTDTRWVHNLGAARMFAPRVGLSNVAIYTLGAGATAPFSLLVTDSLPDVQMLGAGQNGQYYSLCRYVRNGPDGALDLGSEVMPVDGVPTD